MAVTRHTQVPLTTSRVRLSDQPLPSQTRTVWRGWPGVRWVILASPEMAKHLHVERSRINSRQWECFAAKWGECKTHMPLGWRDNLLKSKRVILTISYLIFGGVGIDSFIGYNDVSSVIMAGCDGWCDGLGDHMNYCPDTSYYQH